MTSRDDSSSHLFVNRFYSPYQPRPLSGTAGDPPKTPLRVQQVHPPYNDFAYDLLAEVSFDITTLHGQQQQLVSDVTNCLMGFNGACIKANPICDYWAERTFTIADNISSNHKGLAERALEVASQCSLLRRFVSRNQRLNAGRINNALACVVNRCLEGPINDRYLLRSYSTLLSLWVQLQAFSRNVEAVYKVVREVVEEEAAGPNTLSIIHRTTAYICFTEPELAQKYSAMMVCAAEPFFRSMEVWIYRGLLDDPSNEFMVAGNKRFEEPDGNGSRFPDDYWQHRFVLVESKTPVFLESVVDKIYLTGKYLDIIRKTVALSASLKTMTPIPLRYSTEPEAYLQPIEAAYKFANSYLVTLLIGDYKIYSYITLMKNVFFLEQGDVFGFLLDNCEDILKLPSSEICLEELNSSLESSFHCLSGQLSKLGVSIKAVLRKESLEDQITTIMCSTKEESKEKDSLSMSKGILGLKSFTLNIELKWPECLVLNKKSLTSYQMIFRHFFYLKYVYTKLARLIWFKKELGSKGHLLRNLMTLFLRELLHQTTTGQVEVNWLDFDEKLMKANSVSEIVELHEAFLYQSMSSCLLNIPIQYAALMKVVDVCLDFSLLPPEQFTDCVDVYVKHFQRVILNFNKATKSYPYANPPLFHLNPLHYLPQF